MSETSDLGILFNKYNFKRANRWTRVNIKQAICPITASLDLLQAVHPFRAVLSRRSAETLQRSSHVIGTMGSVILAKIQYPLLCMCVGLCDFW